MPAVLLHTCCAPCSGYLSRRLSEDYAVSIYFDNSNIYPKSEYDIRLDEAKRFFSVEGFEFIDAIKGGAIPKEFISPIEKGVKEAMENGVLAGYPMVDMAVELYDGTFHEVDSSEIAFKIAGSMAFQNGAKQAQPTILEPIMKVEVTTPDEFMGDIIGDLGAKRAQIQSTHKRGFVTVIVALVPLAELSGYATTIRSMSKGRATYYMEPSHYEEVPKNIQEKIIAKKA